MITLTDWELSTLRCAAATGQGFRPACEEIHRSPRTVKAALKQMGMHEEISARFAKDSGQRSGPRTDGTIKVFTLDAIRNRPPQLPDNPQAQWLARAWRE